VYDQVIPTVLEIPSPGQPYNPDKDPIMVRINKLLGSQY
jgi:vacuolar-type H+-ATPase subunit F/Vma7